MFPIELLRINKARRVARVDVQQKQLVMIEQPSIVRNSTFTSL
jgi:hypothetical protein